MIKVLLDKVIIHSTNCKPVLPLPHVVHLFLHLELFSRNQILNTLNKRAMDISLDQFVQN